MIALMLGFSVELGNAKTMIFPLDECIEMQLTTMRLPTSTHKMSLVGILF